MFFPTLTTFSAVLLALSTSAQALGGNAHSARPRRAQHFGRQADSQPQPPAGAKVYTTQINQPEGYNATHALVDGEMVRRGEGIVDLEARGGPVGKRAFSGMRATYYAIGLGACGQYDSEPAYIVALNSAQYGGGYPGPQCFKSITITGGSRNGHAVATIKDECPTCPYGGLDMSEALFSNFASADEGVATITWWFNDDAPPPPPPPAPTTSTTPAWTPPAPEPTTSSTPAWTPPPQETSTTPAYTPPTTSQTPSSTSVWTPPASTSSSSTYVAPPPSSSSSAAPSSSTTPASSSSASSSSVASSSAASSSSFSMSSLALGKAAATSSVTGTNTAATASSTATAGTNTDTEQTGYGNYNGASGNLEMLADVTLQIGNMVVLSAQQSR